MAPGRLEAEFDVKKYNQGFDMDVSFQRRVDRLVGKPLCWALSLWNRLGRKERSPRTQKILVVLLSEMGALVLARPMLTRLKEKYPQAG